MNAPTITNRDLAATRHEIRRPEIGPALRRDVLLQRVRAARKRLNPASDSAGRLR